MFFDSNVMAPNSPVIPTAVGLAILQAYALDWIKRFDKLPQVTYFTNRLNTVLRLLMAGAGTLGVSWTWSKAGTGHELLISIPAWSALLSGLYHWGVAYGMQHFSEIVLSQRPTAQKAIQQQILAAPAAPSVSVTPAP